MTRPIFFSKIRHAKTSIIFKKITKSDLNLTDDLGRTILHWLPIWTGDDSNWKTDEIIKMGANINIRDNNGLTPLDFAVYNGNVELVKLLLKNGAKKSVKTIQMLNYNREEMEKILKL